MSRHNGTRHETAFTTSIEAKDGVTTGISAADRARTVSVAIDASKGPEHIVTPGHVFPLVAREGGVLIRAGHTEAAVDVARLAGLNPSGVICEIMREDGTMARMDDLVAFAQRHGLKIGTIRDLIAYRLKKDHLVEQTAETQLRERLGRDLDGQGLPQQGRGAGDRWPWSRASSTRRGRPWSGCTSSTCSPTRSARRACAERPARRGDAGDRRGRRGSDRLPRPPGGPIRISSTPGPARRAKDMDQLRDYGGGAQILSALGIHDMILLTNTHHTPIALEGYGLKIVGERPIPGRGLRWRGC
jgi:3,4-dihydroxy 2-butanone 4-phosphate synthase/GTP cyclohydrolase II